MVAPLADVRPGTSSLSDARSAADFPWMRPPHQHRRAPSTATSASIRAHSSTISRPIRLSATASRCRNCFESERCADRQALARGNTPISLLERVPGSERSDGPVCSGPRCAQTPATQSGQSNIDGAGENERAEPR